MDYNIPIPSIELCRELGEDLKNPASQYSIEKIWSILSKEYSYEEMCIMEAEFILQHILRHFPELENEEIDSNFINKLYAIPALLKQPLLLTQSLFAFYNAVLLCNNLPAGIRSEDELRPVPTRYLSRMIMSVNDMLPDDMDLVEMYLHPNIRRFIYDMYVLEDNFILDMPFAYLQDEFLDTMFTVPRAAELRKVVRDMTPVLTELRKMAVHAITQSDTEDMEDDFEVYPALRKLNIDLDTVKADLYKSRYSVNETRLFSIYPSDTYYGRAVALYLSGMLYTYLFELLNSSSVKAVTVVAVDTAAFADDGGADRLKTLLTGRYSEDSGSAVKYIMYEPEVSDGSVSDRLIEHLGEILSSDPTIRRYRAGDSTAPDSIADDLYRAYGPPSRPVIVTSYPAFRKSVIRQGSDNQEYPGWDITVLI